MTELDCDEHSLKDIVARYRSLAKRIDTVRITIWRFSIGTPAQACALRSLANDLQSHASILHDSMASCIIIFNRLAGGEDDTSLQRKEEEAQWLVGDHIKDLEAVQEAIKPYLLGATTTLLAAVEGLVAEAERTLAEAKARKA